LSKTSEHEGDFERRPVVMHLMHPLCAPISASESDLSSSQRYGSVPPYILGGGEGFRRVARAQRFERCLASLVVLSRYDSLWIVAL
jgi:hypothetical protein